MAAESRRQEQRRVLIDDILTAARQQLEAGGPAAVSLRGIGRSVGMSAPSLYTYFPSLRHVFTELIVQSFDALAAHVGSAAAAATDEPLHLRLRVGPRAYRSWAVAHPRQFNLIFFDQIDGYEAPPAGPTVEAQTAALRPIAEHYAEARGVDMDTLMAPGDLLDDLLGWWGTFHGLVALEVNHHLDWVDAAAVFERRLTADIDALLAH